MYKISAMLILALGLAAGAGGDNTPAKIEGTWTMTSTTTNGKKVPNETIAKAKVVYVFGDGKWTVLSNDIKSDWGTYKVDTSKKPTTIDLTSLAAKERGLDIVKFGIYKIDDDKLTLAEGFPAGKTRPKSFEDVKDTGLSLFKRQK